MNRRSAQIRSPGNYSRATRLAQQVIGLRLALMAGGESATLR
jgi:hypothetical protein